jgi:hypothetical protein
MSRLTGDSLVKDIGGVGVKKSQYFRQVRIVTLRDLADTELQEVPGLSRAEFQKFKQSAVDALDPTVRLTHHNWFRLKCHVNTYDVHKHICIKRARVREIIISYHEVWVKVQWRQGGQLKEKHVAPSSLLYLQRMHAMNDVLSDDEYDDGSEFESRITEWLPRFKIFNHPELQNLNCAQNSALLNLVRETNTAYDTIWPRGPPPCLRMSS